MSGKKRRPTRRDRAPVRSKRAESTPLRHPVRRKKKDPTRQVGSFWPEAAPGSRRDAELMHVAPFVGWILGEPPGQIAGDYVDECAAELHGTAVGVVRS